MRAYFRFASANLRLFAETTKSKWLKIAHASPIFCVSVSLRCGRGLDVTDEEGRCARGVYYTFPTCMSGSMPVCRWGMEGGGWGGVRGVMLFL